MVAAKKSKTKLTQHVTSQTYTFVMMCTVQHFSEKALEGTMTAVCFSWWWDHVI